MKRARLSTILAFVIALLGLSVGETPLAKNAWAFLVGGFLKQYGILNYSQQANVAHSYHTMIAAGFSPERIIVMMNDSAAFDPRNPTPGVLINRPNGPNVLKGVKIDYNGNEASAADFLNVLSGNKSAMKGIGTGRVIESNEDTNVFVYFSDHGGDGCLMFGHDLLYADVFHNTLKAMHHKKLYKKMILYIEACHAGSMFDNILDEDIGVYAITASARNEDARQWYCGEFPSLPDLCLGGEFSTKWLEHMDMVKMGTRESLFHQFEYLRSQVDGSHVNIYGDFSFGFDYLTPNAHSPAQHWTPDSIKTILRQSREDSDGTSPALAYYRRRAQRTQHPEDLKRLSELIEGHQKAEELFERLVELAIQDEEQRTVINTQYLPLRRDIFPCYRDLVTQFTNECFKPIEYFRKHFHKFANLCVLETDATELKRRMSSVCAPYKASMNLKILA